jgi:hypothetical protein
VKERTLAGYRAHVTPSSTRRAPTPVPTKSARFGSSCSTTCATMAVGTRSVSAPRCECFFAFWRPTVNARQR